MRVVIDTKVVVSAMLSPHAPPAQVVRAALQGGFTPLHDERVLAEYREVLPREKFGFRPDGIDAVLVGLEWVGEMVFTTPLPVELADPDDLPFLEVAVAGRADALVTGNPRHFRPIRGEHDVDVLSPGELVGRLAQLG